MTIAYDVSHIQTKRGGIGRFADSLLRELLRLDRHNRYVLHGWSFSLDLDALNEFSAENVSTNLARIPGPIKRFYWDRIRTFPVTLSTGPVDIFHSTDPFSPPVRKGKVIVTVLDLISQTHPQFFERTVLEQDKRRWLSVLDSDAVIVPSRYVHAGVIRRVTDKPVVVVAPPLALKFSPTPQAGDRPALNFLGITSPYILFVGTIEPRKNVATLIQAFESLCREGNDSIGLVLAGKMGWMSDNIPAMITASPFASRMKHLNYVPELMLPSIYRHASCFAYPSFLEGYGIPVAEAMGSGIPVITSHGSATAEVAGDAAILIDPHSVRELTRALQLLFGSESEQGRLRSLSLRRAEELRADRGPETVLALYEQLAGQ